MTKQAKKILTIILVMMLAFQGLAVVERAYPDFRNRRGDRDSCQGAAAGKCPLPNLRNR